MADDWETDALLLERWRAGDTTAVDELIARHGDAVVRFFRHKLSGDIEDLVQQTFLHLLERRDHIREGQAMRSYILGIAYNLLRERLRIVTGNVVNLDDESVASLLPGPSSLLGRKQEQRLLVEALRNIPLQSQIELELFYWEGFKANEIADMFGVSPSAMRSRLARSRSLLREKIFELGKSAKLIETTVSALDQWAEQFHHEDPGDDEKSA